MDKCDSFAFAPLYCRAFDDLLPGLYIALVSYHPGLLPTRMALTIAGSRQNVPFPPVVEAILMSFTIELLREAGLRLPRAIGQTIGLIGGVIIGQAAVKPILSVP